MSRVDEFFDFFRGPEIRASLRGKTILDFGCGYGGRTVGYATRYGAKEVIGVEIFENMVKKCAEYAALERADNCRFLLCSQSEIPLADDSVDLVLSYDVMEHVEDPAGTLRELYRVLRPSGRLLLVFTPFWGALSHHLGFATRLPGLHWVFSADSLTNAINRYLKTTHGSSHRKRPLDAPKRSFGGQRWCTPSVNGMTAKEFLALPTEFRFISAHATPLLARYRIFGKFGAVVNELLSRKQDTLGEALSFNLVCIMEKPGLRENGLRAGDSL